MCSSDLNIPVPPGPGTPYGCFDFFCICHMVPHFCEEQKVKIICINHALSFGYLIKICKESDDLDKTEGEAEGSSDHAIKAYTPPWMRPTGCASESSSVQPLVRCLI